jgi:two-component system, chemotaxis family, protein-glutamate methylesterase/glutaminase
VSRIRIVVVEDSLTVRNVLCDVLASDPEIELVGQGTDGKEAIDLVRRLRPDVVTLDMMMPVMSGLAATEYIMAHVPTPILIVSSSTNRGELFRTYDALAAGAVDAVEKPRGDEPEGVWERRFLATVKLVSRIKVITHPRARLTTPVRQHAFIPAPGKLAGTPQLVAIGASTGGPAAIMDILQALPARILLPVLFVLHIGEPFGSAFVEWLDGQSAHRVSYPRNGEQIAKTLGRIIMAPPERHLIVREGRLWIVDGPERHSCRPSVDVLFESVSHEYKSTGVGCLLTGMGKDGAAGLLAMRRAGALTIAQDEATSVVYGMPREAALVGAAERVLSLPDIARTIASIVSGNGVAT